MGSSVESIKKTCQGINVGIIVPTECDKKRNNGSIFLEKENNSFFNMKTISIASMVLLGITGLCFAPKLLKFIKGSKLNTDIKKGLAITGSSTTSATAGNSASEATSMCAKKLSLNEKMCLIKEKFNLTEEELSNPTLRHNVENLYEFLISRKARIGKQYLTTRKFTFSSEGLSQMDKLDVNWALKMRAELKNYPVEIMEYAGKAEKTLPHISPVNLQTNFGSNPEQGKRIMDWYQNTFNNSGEVNNALRGIKPFSKEAREVVTFFDSHKRPIGSNGVLIRGTDFAEGLKPGSIITDKGYMSCATKQGFLDNVDTFDGAFTKFKNYLIIKTPANQSVIVPSDWTKVDSMGERILPKGTSLRVLEVHPLTDYGNNQGRNIVEGRRAIICEIV